MLTNFERRSAALPCNYTMKIKFLGHACFLIDTGKTRIIVDPFLTGNPSAAVAQENVDVDYVFVTHAHDDHIGDTDAICQRTGATCVTTVDVGAACFGDAKYPVVTNNLGGWMPFDFGRVKTVAALHGSGALGALSCGYVFDIDGKRIYHAGDTALISDMAFLADEDIDVALLPIGDFFTMGPKDALKATKLIQPKTVIPMHYNTFPPIKQDEAAFKNDVENAGFKCEVLKPGEEYEL